MNTRIIPVISEGYKTGSDADSRNFIFYTPDSGNIKALIVYIHGGGLLYGTPGDLPEMHLQKLTGHGYAILAIDYPLAPQAKMDVILEDVIDSINKACEISGTDQSVPFFLWGRSAGAYLVLLASSSNKLTVSLNGIISYYGYGFLNDGWYDAKSSFYCQLPAVPEDLTKITEEKIVYSGSLDEYYSTYVYARQTGKWKDLIYEGRDKYFFLYYTLRAIEQLPAPVFATHSSGDTDVPYSEFIAFSNKYRPEKFIVSIPEHDFDRNTDNPETAELLDRTSLFIEKHL